MHFSDQADTDSDNIGDVCDNCRTVSNNAQTDSDNSGIGDSCSTNQDRYGSIYLLPAWVVITIDEMVVS